MQIVFPRSNNEKNFDIDYVWNLTKEKTKNICEKYDSIPVIVYGLLLRQFPAYDKFKRGDVNRLCPNCY